MKREKSQQLIVFDMDGVLIDVSTSYREAVRQTARAFFLPAKESAALPDPLFSLAELAEIKQGGGLNNDWDLTYFIIRLLFTLVERPEQIEEGRTDWNGYRQTMARCNVSGLAAFMQGHKSPLKTLLKKNQNRSGHAVNVLSNESKDIGDGNIVKQIFQEFYLGKDLFGNIYGMPPQVYTGKGYIHRERLLADKVLLEKLARFHILAVATGRPKNEADFALDHHGIRQCFKAVYTLDDCIREENRILKQEGRRVCLSKPDPFMLDAIAKAVGPKPLIAYYLGDMPDDMLAAGRSRVGFVGVGIVAAAPDKQVLRRKLLRAGADYIIEDLKQVEEIVAV